MNLLQSIAAAFLQLQDSSTAIQVYLPETKYQCSLKLTKFWKYKKIF